MSVKFFILNYIFHSSLNALFAQCILKIISKKMSECLATMFKHLKGLKEGLVW